MKVLFVTEQKIMGGGEWNLLFLIKELHNYNLDIGVLSCNDNLLNQLPDTIKKFNDPSVNKRGWLSFIPLIWRQINVKKITGQDWDVIHIYSPNLTCRMLWNCSRKVWTVHGPWEHANGLRGAQLQLFIDKFLPVSQDVNNTCTITESKVRCIELGIKPSSYSKKSKRSKTQVLRTINFLCLGRYQPVKGQDILLQALGKMCSYLPQNFVVNMSFYGEVDQTRKEDVLYYEQLMVAKAEFDNSDQINVTFNPSCKEIETLFDWADVCIIPSRYESFSMVAAESLSFGIPIIVSDKGAPHTFLDGKSSGLIFENDNADSLASCLKKMIDKHESFNCFSGYKDRFSISRQAKEILEVYREVMG
ncbi:glycosyltransferase family 4 protein [Vibrio parahaemolyticus]|uniref:WcuF n=1 Tax=Vibrio parahaemolyticus TaxID=670 RepID=A0A5P5X5J6_VIBPH|nr:glycosyltransferase family 4 protein [Vibrio parahaemolyticus]QFF90523.1 WcuF [Vibrio parahaemolyticus]